MTKIRGWRCFSVVMAVALILGVGAIVVPRGPTLANGATWDIKTVEEVGSVSGDASLAMDSLGNPHIVCKSDSLKYVSSTNGGIDWTVHTVTGADHVSSDYDIALALDSNNNPHISYFDEWTGYIQYATSPDGGTTWNVKTVDTAGILGWYNSIAVDSNNRPHISYYNKSATPKTIKYATSSDGGNTWSVTTVDSSGDYVGQYNSIAVDHSNPPHIGISYFHWISGVGRIKYASRTGTGPWTFQTVDETNLGQYTSLAMESNGTPHVTYWDYTNNRLKYATSPDGGTTWNPEFVAASDTVGGASLAVDGNHIPHISCNLRSNGQLEYGRRAGPESWGIQPVDEPVSVGFDTWLALDSSNNPHICYWNSSDHVLKYASYTTCVLPGAAGTITGTATVCQGESGVVYSVPAITDATSYIWSYSGGGATIINETTNSITIDFSGSATGGNLTVRGHNSCGDGPISNNYAITVNPLPASAGTITGSPTVTQGQSNVAYSVPAIADATSYIWSYSGTGAAISGPTSSITIDFSGSATSGDLTVKGHNSCGDGAISNNYAITVNPPEAGVPTVTTDNATCVATASATLNMSYTNGGYNPVSVGFAYKKSAVSIWIEPSWVPKAASGDYAQTLTGLDANTLYDFKAELKYDSTVIPGSSLQFTTLPGTPPNFMRKWGAGDATGNSGSNNGEFSSPSGVAVDPEGNVYVADTGNNRIQKFDGSNWTSYGGPGTAVGQFKSPTGVAVDSAGNVYVADWDNNRIQKYSGGTWSLLGSGVFNHPWGVAVDSADNIYVADSQNNRIRKFDGTSWATFGSGEFDTPCGVAVDSAGNVYVADTYKNRIQKFTSDGTYVTMWVSDGTANGAFNMPYGVAVDSAGNVHVADTYKHRMQVFNSCGGFITKWGRNGGAGSSGSGNGEFKNPRGVAVDSAGNVYVADTVNNRIQKFGSAVLPTVTTTGATDITVDSAKLNMAFDFRSQGPGQVQFWWKKTADLDWTPTTWEDKSDSGNYSWALSNLSDNTAYQFKARLTYNSTQIEDVFLTFTTQSQTTSPPFILKWGRHGGDGSWGTGNGEFYYTSGVAVDSSGNVYVADVWNYRVQKFNGTNWATLGSGFAHPSGVAVDSTGNVYVADYGNSRIQKYSGGTWATFGSGQFDHPGGVAVDSAGNVYIADYHRIRKFNGDGTVLLAEWGSYGSGDGEFEYPRGVAVDSSGNIYVADYGNSRVQKFNGTSWTTFGSGYGGFAYAQGVAVDSAGNVYVADYGHHRIVKFDSSGKFLTKWGRNGGAGSSGSGNGEFYDPEGVAVDSWGNVYVADTWNHRIQKFGFTSGPTPVPPAEGTGTITAATGNGNMQDLTAVAVDSLPQEVQDNQPTGVEFPYGLLSFNITSIAPGGSATVTITYPKAMDKGTKYWKCQNGNWINCTSLLGDDDGDNVLTLTLTDGSTPGDSDGVANGTIVDPGGPVIAAAATPAPPAPAPPAPAPPAPAGSRASSTQPKPLKLAQTSLQYLSINPQQTSANQPVTILTNVVNTGDEAGNCNVALKINGQVEQSRMVSVGPQGTQPVKFTVTKAQPGTYTVDIGGQKGRFVIAGSRSGGGMGEGLLLAVAAAVIVILLGLVIIIARRRLRSY